MKTIVRMGNPVLLRAAETITAFDIPWLHAFAAEMFEAMRIDKGVGLAAPQLGESIRMVVLAYPDPNNRRGISPIPATVLINPGFTRTSNEIEEDWETCLSVPGLIGKVPRWKHIRYEGLDLAGKTIARDAEGFHARIIQHECDHLIGRLYPTRITDLSKFGFKDEIKIAGEMDRI